MTYSTEQLQAMDTDALERVLTALRDDALTKRRALDRLQVEIAAIARERDGRLKKPVGA